MEMDRIRICTYLKDDSGILLIQDIKETSYRKTKKGYLAKDICEMIISSLEEFPKGQLEIIIFNKEENKNAML